MTSASKDPLVWIDCEMTGLDAETESIMSVACFVTDHDLNLLDENGYEATIHHSKERLEAMDEWCVKHHGDSGLTRACIASSTSAEEAAVGLLAYIKTHVSRPRTALLAGNSVHADKSFLVKGPWAGVVGWLHYRILDVSAIKEAARRWAGAEVLGRVPRKLLRHEARADVLESIEEARFYRDAFFRR
ncbi:oligoribonuclease-like protein [Massarina eburnea CBS 473.64]|uniref:Oligoribonuclease-like protein n=1 Tax=Massarina eburnea CBS 473.64 TaxID=1395130 RepID=A0A6A6SE16_9PLEO|nr:oligoribonuclease-like protein [Massarina eburnea CBS 473.64]